MVKILGTKRKLKRKIGMKKKTNGGGGGGGDVEEEENGDGK